MKKKIKNIIRKYFRPFWFSSGCEEIKPPYVYGFLLQMALFTGVYMFFKMAWLKYDSAILGTTGIVLGTLAGLYFGVLNLFTKGRTPKVTIKKNDTKEENYSGGGN